MIMSPTDSSETATDGGSVDEMPFDTVATEPERGRTNRLGRYLDRVVLTPMRIIWDDRRAKFGLAVMALYALMGTVGVMYTTAPRPDEGPAMIGVLESSRFILGTDAMGKGIFRQIIHGTPAMLKMILAGSVFTTVVATVVGTLSGYKRGTVDSILMFFTDVAMTIPGLPLVIVVAVIFQPRDPFLIGIIIAINAWAGLARTIRSQVLSIRNESYVEASRVMGFATSNILVEDLLPNLMPYIMVNFVYSARNVIFASVGLYFLGFLPFTTTNWGVMMYYANETGGALYSFESAHWIVAPMITVIVLTFGLIMFAQGTDRLFNPRVRARHSKTLQEEDAEEVEEEVTTAEEVAGKA
jgi:peptide/nickel transport system permease protein